MNKSFILAAILLAGCECSNGKCEQKQDPHKNCTEKKCNMQSEAPKVEVVIPNAQEQVKTTVVEVKAVEEKKAE